MNLGQLRDATRDRIGVSDTDAMLTDTVIDRLVNNANAYIATVHDWPWQSVTGVTFNTVANQADYTPGTFAPAGDWLRTVDLRVAVPPGFGDGLTLYSVMELDDRNSSAPPAQPTEYAVFGDKIRLGPTPDGVYSVGHRYIKVEGDMVLDSDVPLMPAQFTPMIAEYAAFLGCRRISEEPRANVAMAAFNSWLAQVQQDRKRSTAPQRVRVRPGNLI